MRFRGAARVVPALLLAARAAAVAPRPGRRLRSPRWRGASAWAWNLRAPPGALAVVGNDGAPAWAGPLGECEGDCDTNADSLQLSTSMSPSRSPSPPPPMCDSPLPAWKWPSQILGIWGTLLIIIVALLYAMYKKIENCCNQDPDTQFWENVSWLMYYPLKLVLDYKGTPLFVTLSLILFFPAMIGIWIAYKRVGCNYFIIAEPIANLVGVAILTVILWDHRHDGGFIALIKGEHAKAPTAPKVAKNIYADLHRSTLNVGLVGFCQLMFFGIFWEQLYRDFAFKTDEDFEKDQLDEGEHQFWLLFLPIDRKQSQFPLFLFGGLVQGILFLGLDDYDKMTDLVEFWFDAFLFIDDGKLKFNKIKDGAIQGPTTVMMTPTIIFRMFLSILVNVWVRLCIQFLLPFKLSMAKDVNAVIFNLLGAYFIIKLDDLTAAGNIEFVCQGDDATVLP